jgi:ABC-type nitrate/sulfonate/bicarbonate transport system substrate-binding protein
MTIFKFLDYLNIIFLIAMSEMEKHKMNKQKYTITGKKSISIIVSFLLAVTGSILMSPNSQAAKDMQTVKVALSSFQDVCSIYVGIEKGFYKAAGIKLDVKRVDWPGANELGVGGQVDMWTTSDADVVQQNNSGADTTLAFPLFYFGGGGLMFDPKKYDWKTYDEISAGSKNIAKNIATALAQLKGKKIGVSSGGGEYATFVELVSVAGFNMDEYKIIDLAQEELPPALISGSIDIMIAGIPQRLAVTKVGYKTLMDQRALPSTIVHAGFGAKRSWVKKNLVLSKKIQGVIFKTLAYVEKNPNVAFPIISKCLAVGGTKVDAADLTGVWNVMEFFPNGKPWYNKEVRTAGGKFYWKQRFQTVITNLQKEKKIKSDFSVRLSDLNYGLITTK